MDWDPIRTNSAADLSLVAAQSDDEIGSAAEFVIDLAGRYRHGQPLRVDSELAQFLTVDRASSRPKAHMTLGRRLAAAGLPVAVVVALVSANALPAAAEDVFARAVRAVGITLPAPDSGSGPIDSRDDARPVSGVAPPSGGSVRCTSVHGQRIRRCDRGDNHPCSRVGPDSSRYRPGIDTDVE